MPTKVKASFEFVSDNGAAGKVQWDSETQQLVVTGTLYPWMIKSVMEYTERIRDSTKPASVHQKPST